MSTVSYDVLSETRNRLVNEIELLSNQEFNKKYDPSKWSIAQVCHHLVLTENIFTKVIGNGLQKSDNDRAERKNISLILDRTKKRSAPEIVEPNSEPMEVQQVVDLLNHSRTKLLDLLNTVEDESKLAEKSAKHPVFGELSLAQWIEFIYLHEQRHIEQIKEIKQSIGI